MSTNTLPRLLDRKALAEELGVPLATAENIMRKCTKITVGRRVFVRQADVEAQLRKASSS